MIFIFIFTAFALCAEVSLSLGDKFYRDSLYGFAAEQYEKYLDDHYDSRDAGRVLFRLAYSKYRTGEHGESLKYFDRFISAYPENRNMPPALFYKAGSESELEKFDDAGRTYKRLYEDYPSWKRAEEALFLSGKSSYLANDFEKALPAFQRFLLKYPVSEKAPEAFVLSGRVYLERKEYKKALSSFSKCAENFGPEKGQTDLAVYLAAKVSEKLKLNERAYGYYETFLKNYEKHQKIPDVLRGYAGLLFKTRRLGRCVEILRRYIALEGEEAGPDYNYMLAQCYSMLEQEKEALQGFEAFIQNYPASSRVPEAKYRRAEILRDLKKYELVIEQVENLAAEFPEDPFSYKGLLLVGDIYAAEGLYLNAVNVMRRYLRGDNVPGKDRVAFKIAEIYKNKFKKYGYAVREYESTLKDYPLSEYVDDAYYAIAECREKLGDYSTAIIDYERLKENYPGTPLADSAKTRIDYIRDFNLRDYEKATVKLVEMLLPDRVVSGKQKILSLADIYENDLKEYEKAVDVYNSFLDVYPDSSSKCFVLFRIGKLYEKIGNRHDYNGRSALHARYRNSADSVYRTIFSRFPESEYSDNATFRILENNSANISEYEKFLQNYPSSELAPEALYKIGMHYYRKMKSTDENFYVNAVENFKKITEDYTESEYSPRAFFQMGLTYYEKGDNRSAGFFFSQLAEKKMSLDLMPDSYYYLGMISYRLKDYPAAVEHFKKVTYQYPFSGYTAKSLLMSAESYFRMKDYKNARKLYRTFAGSYTSSEQLYKAYYGLAECKAAFADTSDALRLYSEVVKRFPESPLTPHAYYNIAELTKSGGDTEKALEYYEKAAAPGKYSVYDAVKKKANALFDLGKYRQASDAYSDMQKRAAARQDSIDAWSGKIVSIIMYKEKKNVNKEIRDFKRTYPDARSAMARISFYDALRHQNKELYRKAISRYEDVIKKFESSKYAEEALFNTAECYTMQEDFSRALKHYNVFLMKYPNSTLAPDAGYSVAKIHFFLKDFYKSAETALEVFNSALSSKPDLAYKSLFNAMAAYEKLSLWKELKKTSALVLEHFGDSKEVKFAALSKIAFCDVQMKDYASALENYKKAAGYADDEDKPRMQYWIAKCYSMTGEDRKAISEFLKVPYLFSTSGMWALTAEFEAALIYERSGDITNALTLYRKVLKADGRKGKVGTRAAERIEFIEKGKADD